MGLFVLCVDANTLVRLGESHSQGYDSNIREDQLQPPNHSRLEPRDLSLGQPALKVIQYHGTAELPEGRNARREAQEYVSQPQASTALRRSGRARVQKELTKPGEPNGTVAANPKSQRQPPTVRPKTKAQLEWDAGYKRLEQEVHAATGFKKPPDDNSTKEESDRYLYAVMEYLHKRQGEKNRQWPTLEEGKEFIRQMGRQTFTPRYDEEEGIPEFKKFTDPPPVRTKSRAPQKSEKEKKAQASQEHLEVAADAAGTEKEPLDDAGKFHGAPKDKKATQRSEKVAVKREREPESQERDGQPARKRAITDELQSSLGAGWDPVYGIDGGRTTRNAKKHLS